MCGITGFWKRERLNGSADEILNQMTDALIHRGPDGRGVWADSACGIAFGHRRLAIRDLSDAGHQPMTSDNRRFVLSYNGEIYNTDEIRIALISAGHKFRGRSDTEVFLEAVSAWGVFAAIPRLAGMFAASIWDAKERQLYLVRDRLGIKPLYWGFIGSQFVFGSELKSIAKFPNFSREIDTSALCDYFRYGVVHAPRSIYKNISKLLPGTILTYSGFDAPKLTTYWKLTDHVINDGTRSVEELDDLLPNLVRSHMESDVPIGTFLSGGIDSSLVTGLANLSVSPERVTSFTVGFDEEKLDESRHAKLVADKLGTNHIEIRATPESALGLIEALPHYFDEPFADSSQLPTMLISKLARQ
ncbi:MAG: asparagine synthase (glutamine-hydrolyzing), partial [Pirellulales bacterium]